MTGSSRLSANVSANVAQTAIGALMLFGLYRYVNSALGIEQLGVWSVILATASISRLADAGLGASVIRFVARDVSQGQIRSAVEVVETVAITLGAAVAAFAPVAYLGIHFILPRLFEGVHLYHAFAILPIAIASFWLSVIASVYQGALDGCERMDRRAALMIGGQVVLVACTLLLVPKLGIAGLAWAQLIQSSLTCVLGQALVRTELPGVGYFPRHFSVVKLREMLRYGINIQVSTVFVILFDPITKAMLAGFGGPADVGAFEMASQVVLKTRAVIVSANQAIVPRIASFADASPRAVRDLYKTNIRLLTFVSLPLFTLLVTWSGLVSLILVGDYNRQLAGMICLLSIAWGANVFAGPAYFSNLGSGEIGMNTASHVAMGFLNVLLGLSLGSLLGASGVLASYVLALIAGTSILVISFQKKHRIRAGDVLALEHVTLSVACAILVIGFGLLTFTPLGRHATGWPMGLLLPPCVLGIAAWVHPARKQLVSSIRRF